MGFGWPLSLTNDRVYIYNKNKTLQTGKDVEPKTAGTFPLSLSLSVMRC